MASRPVRNLAGWMLAAAGALVAAAALAAPSRTDVSADSVLEGPADNSIIEFRPTPDSAQTPAARNPRPFVSGNPLWSIPMSSLPATRDRPIFSPSRRQPSPLIAAPQIAIPVTSPPPEPERFSLGLIGTITHDADAVAVFVEQNSRQIIRLRQGEAYAGWVLRSVRNREVSLEKGSLMQTVTMPKSNDVRP